MLTHRWQLMVHCCMACFFFWNMSISKACALPYLLLQKNQYKSVVHESQIDVIKILNHFEQQSIKNKDDKIHIVINMLLDKPYSGVSAIGEGDWISTASTYHEGALHLDQAPVYRLDQFDCQTFVQTLLALLHANHLNEFETAYIKTAYGAYRDKNANEIHNYNRNHFIEGDFNRENASLHWLQNVTSNGRLKDMTKNIVFNLSRKKWFLYKSTMNHPLIRVFTVENAKEMINYFNQFYLHLNKSFFISEKIRIDYLPKALLVNQDIINAIPTPSIIEIVHDPERWKVNGVPIKFKLGTALSISHLGILYRETFNKNAVIYYHISCANNNELLNNCIVVPITCTQTICHELMFAHATDAYPVNYIWSHDVAGYHCSRTLAANSVLIGTCNRVERLPFIVYLTQRPLGVNPVMDRPSVVGIHIEKIL